MSGAISASTILTVAAVAGSAYMANDAAKKQAAASDRAVAESRRASDAQMKQNEENINRANSRRADSAGALASAQQAGKEGGGSTMLTGTQGIDPNSLNLSKSTLLGG